MSLLKVFDVAGSGLAAQSMRLNTTASNLANADSVAGDASKVYRARQPVFAAALREFSADGASDDAAVGVRVLGIVESQAPVTRRYEPGNPLADAEGYVWASNVNTVEALADMISASRTFQSNVEVINTSRDLLLKTITMGR
ncbi:MAG TPA: flagellar basal body rod protein FlgC [Steroidobacteraceae bacterium]|nr:flagellar basal body rod protein FlgC [Steroidobacteraceae bacterium]